MVFFPLRCYLAAAPLVMGAVPTSMQAGALTKRDSQVHVSSFQEISVKTPAPGSGEVLIKVAGASINPCEWKEIESSASRLTIPHISGHDVAGTIAAVGRGVRQWKVGDKVWAFAANEGCHAEYVKINAKDVGVAPSTISLQEAAVMPLVALTDLLGFRKGGADKPGKTVLVLGGSGGTGHVAIQMAKAYGAAKVITTCGTSNLEFCNTQGADTIIDYHKSSFHDVVAPRSVDFVYDCVAQKGTGDLAYDVLKDGGAYITLLPDSLASNAVAKSRPSIHQEFFLLNEFTTTQLDELKAFVEAGKLRPHVQKTFTLAEVGQLFSTSMAGHTVGKNLIVPTAADLVV